MCYISHVFVSCRTGLFDSVMQVAEFNAYFIDVSGVCTCVCVCVCVCVCMCVCVCFYQLLAESLMFLLHALTCSLSFLCRVTIRTNSLLPVTAPWGTRAWSSSGV